MDEEQKQLVAVEVPESMLNPDTKIPEMWEEEWTDYVIKHLTEDELYNGNPTADGLRRVSMQLLGTIVKNVTHTIESPTERNNYGATVEKVIEIRFREDGEIRVFSEVADVTKFNTDMPYSLHPSATASSKAEGRAFKKALALKRILTAEEVAGSPTIVENDPSAKASFVQKNLINHVCKQYNIDVDAFINMGSGKYDSIDVIPKNTALLMIKKLQEFQKDLDSIPEKIKIKEENE